ncbi:MAG TPA: serine/threonine-protein kinase [Gemmatimonadaceae bacterium]|nr:serine/threonine-protein kinase [Gemmatimonadaceae bacterium]
MPDPIALSSDAEMRALAERALAPQFDVESELGRGGMGIVYRARDRRLKRDVAVKVLPPELAYRGEIKSRFLREAETAAQLNQPNIVPIYAVDEREGLVFFVMACVDGTTVGKRLHDEGALPVDDARRIMRQVADALAYAHARGVIHRDIKPDNILLDRESKRAMVTDFGIARAMQEGADSRLTATGMAIGTPAFMSPEQAAGEHEIDGRSDLYSLGVVGYQMLTGQLPFKAGSTASMLMKQITERPAPVHQLRPDVPPDLGAIVMTLLEKEPANRFPSASALSAALSGDASAMPAASATAATPDRPYAGAVPTSPLPAAYAPGVEPAGVPPGAGQYTTPTPDDIARWSAPEVQHFRSRFAKFAFVNAAIIIASILTGSGLYVVTVFWGIWLAAKYSKLWSSGYDWRDVFRQPRDRRLLDVASETIEYAQTLPHALFNPKEREKLRARSAQRATLPPAHAMSASSADFGAYVDTVQRAERDRAEVIRQVSDLPKGDQKLVNGVIPAADGLYNRVKSLASSLAELDRTLVPDAGTRIERDIATLEAQANPLDVAASEHRVRQLATLKRERRAQADARKRQSDARAKLESCGLALQNMRLDVLRLRAGGVANVTGQITLLTERARSLADDVDAAVQGASSVRR